MSASHVSGRQIAAARALLGLSLAEVAAAAGLNEGDVGIVEGGSAPVAHIEALRVALEGAGIEFIDGGAPGVRLRPPPEGLRADQLNASNDD